MLEWATSGAVARPIALTAVALTAAAVRGQSAPFLVPDRYAGAVGEELRLSVRTAEPGHPGEADLAQTDWPGVEWFFARVGGTQENRSEVVPGDAGAVTWPLTHAGVTMVGVDFEPVIETVPGERFARLLAERTAAAVPPDLATRESVRVRHIRSVKTLVTVRAPGAPTPDAATGVSKAGQAVEIRPLFDPTATPVGGDLPLRMYIDGDAFGKPRIVATHAPSGASVTLGGGEGVRSTLDLRITGPGPWRVEFRHAAPLVGDAAADWVLYSATLTFEAPAAREAGR